MNIKELAEAMCRYDLDDMDLHWLKELNAELAQMGECFYYSLLLWADAFIQSNFLLVSLGPVFSRITQGYVPCSRA